MNWPVPPYPPDVEPPGTGFILLMGGISFCFFVLVICLAVRAALAHASPPPPSQPNAGTEPGSEG